MSVYVSISCEADSRMIVAEPLSSNLTSSPTCELALVLLVGPERVKLVPITATSAQAATWRIADGWDSLWFFITINIAQLRDIR